MPWPTCLQIALKEWAVVCAALESATQIMLLRKGGIIEGRHGFAPQHREFLLFPTYLHQNPRMLKPAFHAQLHATQSALPADPPNQEPPQVRITAAGVVSDVIQIRSRAQIDALDDQHIWTAPLIDMRFDYRPQNPLYLLLVRAYRLSEPATLANTPAYAGCKSWVPLNSAIATEGAMPVLDDAAYEKRRGGILKAIE